MRTEGIWGKISPKQKLRARLRSTSARQAVVKSRHLRMRSADAVIASYPRSGNSWLRLMLTSLTLGVDAGVEEIERVIPFINPRRVGPRVLPHRGRLWKSHEKFRKEYGRAVYLVRDVRDVAASAYRFGGRDPLWQHESPEAFEPCFQRYGFYAFGTWVEHVQSWLDAASRDDGILLLRYEQMVANPERALAVAAHFLGIDASADAVREVASRNTRFHVRAKEERTARYIQQRLGFSVAAPFTEVEHPGNEDLGGWRYSISEEERAALQQLGYEAS